MEDFQPLFLQNIFSASFSFLSSSDTEYTYDKYCDTDHRGFFLSLPPTFFPLFRLHLIVSMVIFSGSLILIFWSVNFNLNLSSEF